MGINNPVQDKKTAGPSSAAVFDIMKQDSTKVSKGGGVSDDEKHNLLPSNKPAGHRPNKAHNRYYDESSSLWPMWKRVCMFLRLPLIPERFAICLLTHLGFANLYLLRSNLSVALVPMTANYTVVQNGELHTKADFNWSLKEQGCLQSAFFYGYLLTQIPGGYLANRYGGRKIFGLSICGASLVTLLTPVSANTSYWLLALARFICGLCQGPAYPAVHSMWSRWAPPNERTLLPTLAYSGAYFGTATCFITASYVVMMYGWEYIFYWTALVSLMWYILWSLWGGETPDTDPFVRERELRYIHESIGPQPTYKQKLKVPWSDIITSKPVWAINACHFATNWGFYTLMTLFPRYLTDGLKYNLEAISSVIAWPFIIMALGTIMGGVLSDMLYSMSYMSMTAVRKVIISVTFITQVIILNVVAYGDLTPAEDLACFVCILGSSGLSWAGFGVNHLDIAPDFAGVLLGMSNMIATLPGIISPTLTGFIIENTEDIYDWSIVFAVTGYIILLASVIYFLYGSAEPQPWLNKAETKEETVACESTAEGQERKEPVVQAGAD